jgi:molecular chaperone DnaK
MGIAVGIDLGTSNSCVAVWRDGKPEVLADQDGERIQPSVVAFGFEGTHMVGSRALRQLVYSPETVVQSPKRLMGQRFGSPVVERFRQSICFDLAESPKGDVLVRVRGRDYTVPQVSAMILRHMRAVAEAATGEVVDQAVIGVPAYFSDLQRNATREAASEAGLACLRIVNEPTAAALAYGSGKSLRQNVAVYDLGGGTFDISILRVEDELYEVVGTAGDTYLGGNDFDAVVAEYFLMEAQKRKDLEVRDNRISRLRLLEAAERAKIALSDTAEVSMNITGLARSHQSGEVGLDLRIDRRLYSRLVMPLVQRTFQVCDEALALAQMTTAQIDQVLLVGGMSHMLLVREAVEQYFGKTPDSRINPHEVVAMGAAIQARNLSSNALDAPEPLLLDVTPRSLGIATKGGYVENIIPRNASIPTEATKFFHTATDGQTQVRVAVYQGESRRESENEALGEFLLDGLRPAPRGEVRVRVTFEIDADGIVHVIARDEDSGSRKDLRLNLRPKEG